MVEFEPAAPVELETVEVGHVHMSVIDESPVQSVPLNLGTGFVQVRVPSSVQAEVPVEHEPAYQSVQPPSCGEHVHEYDLVAAPYAEQSAPPFAGVGFVQVRVWTCWHASPVSLTGSHELRLPHAE